MLAGSLILCINTHYNGLARKPGWAPCLHLILFRHRFVSTQITIIIRFVLPALLSLDTIESILLLHLSYLSKQETLNTCCHVRAKSVIYLWTLILN